MRSRDVVIGLGLAAVLAGLIFVDASLGSIGGRLLELLTSRWYLGLGIGVAAILVARRSSVSSTGRFIARLAAVTGVAWAGVLAGLVALGVVAAIIYSMHPGI